MILLKDKLDELTAYPEMSAFRGQVDSKWQLTSGATRRLIEKQFDRDEDAINTPEFPRIYNIYHNQVLIGPARRHGFGIVQGHRISDLQLLAKLQHLGAGTGLLDFTWNPFIALWFACATAAKGIKACEGDGKVFVLNLNDPNKFQRVGTDEEQQRIPDLFSPFSQEPNLNKTRYWEPAIEGEASHRMINQRSVFVIGCPLIPDDAIVGDLVVHSSEKEQLVEELRTFFDITNASLFMDMNGFSVANGAGSDMEKLDDPVKLLLQGNQFLQQGDWANAIASYDLCIDITPEIGETYFYRGNAKIGCGAYSEALQDYDAAIQRKETFFHEVEPHVDINTWGKVYFHRGNVNAELGNIVGSVDDYTTSIQNGGWSDSRLFFNLANSLSMLSRLEEAIDKYDEAIRLGNEAAHFNKGNAFARLGKFEDALSCYHESQNRGIFLEGSMRNRTAADEVLGLTEINGATFELVPRYDMQGLDAFDLVLSIPHDQQSRPYVFCGNIGNFGEFAGFGGKLGFIIHS